MDGTTIVGSATISGTTNGIEIDNATGHGKCYLISGKVQSTATDGDYYAINGTYGGVHTANAMTSEAFYLGGYDGFTHDAHIDAIKNGKKVQVKARDIDHLGSWSNSSSNFTLDTDTNWWYLSN
jgi:hypothetical protein